MPRDLLPKELVSQKAIDGLMPVDLVNDLAVLEADYGYLAARRYDLARKHLVPHDGDWTVNRPGTWVRPYKGWRLYYMPYRNTMTLVRGKEKQRYDNAFTWLYMLLQSEGFEANTVPKQRQRQTFPLPKADGLTEEQVGWLKNIPPDVEMLRLVFGYDADWQVLYYVNHKLGTPEIVPPRPFVEFDGVKYAVSRIVSMLVFGNPYGVPDAEKAAEILSSYPKVETAYTLADVLPEKKAKAKVDRRKKRVLTPPAPKPFHRLSVREQVRILLKEKTDE